MNGFSGTDLPISLTQRAFHLHAAQQDVEAVRCLQHALKLEPQLAPALYLKGLMALAHGNFEIGWPLFELRNARYDASPPAVRYRNRKRWDGKPTRQRVLIWAEEWLGDCVQMLRFIPEVQRRCPNMVLELPTALVRLCKGNNYCANVVEHALPKENNYCSNVVEHETVFDQQCSLLSLPLTLGMHAIPAAPYIQVLPWLTNRWAQIKPAHMHIGLCWQGDPANTFRDSARSIKDEKLIKEFGQDYDFISLHRQHSNFSDVADMAALIANLDLVITVDTLQAHIAGALGKPVWIMLPMDCDWRWMQRRTDTPWYPSARLFRQQTAGDWAGVLANVKTALEERNARTTVVA